MSAALRQETPRVAFENDPIDLPTRRIGRIDVAATKRAEILPILAERLDTLRFTPLAFANAHCVNVAAADAPYADALGRFTVLADGIGVDIASKMLFGAPFPENLNGTDFVPALIGALSGRRRIALVGATPETVGTAAARLRARFPQHEVRAISDGFFRDGLQTQVVLARLRDFSPDVTLVALGVPKQELFIAKHLTIRETTLAVGVGALFDFLSGNIARAPDGWRDLRLEWLYRLFCEPTRLWRRYVLGNPQFLLRVLIERAFGSPGVERAPAKHAEVGTTPRRVMRMPSAAAAAS